MNTSKPSSSWSHLRGHPLISSNYIWSYGYSCWMETELTWTWISRTNTILTFLLINIYICRHWGSCCICSWFPHNLTTTTNPTFIKFWSIIIIRITFDSDIYQFSGTTFRSYITSRQRTWPLPTTISRRNWRSNTITTTQHRTRWLSSTYSIMSTSTFRCFCIIRYTITSF